MSENENPVIKVAKSRSQNGDGVVTLSTGYKAKIRPTGADLISEIYSNIPDPEIPTVYNKDKDRDEPNPFDPGYVRSCEAVNQQRGIAAMDAMILFGVELVDPMPEDSEWLPKLRLLEKMGRITLSKFNLDDPLEKEFLFKRYIAVSGDDLQMVSGASAVNPEAVARKEDSFPDQSKG